MRKRNLSLVVKPHLYERIVAAAEADGRSMSDWVGRVLEWYLNRASREGDAGTN